MKYPKYMKYIILNTKYKYKIQNMRFNFDGVNWPSSRFTKSLFIGHSYLSQGLTLSESHWWIYRYTIDCRSSIYGMKSDHAVIIFNRAMNGLDAGTNNRNIRISTRSKG